MAIAMNKVKAGDVLWQSRRVRMGNTTISETAWYQVRVIEIDHEARTARVSWNGNPTFLVREKYFKSLCRERPAIKPRAWERL